MEGGLLFETEVLGFGGAGGVCLGLFVWRVWFGW